VTTTRMLGGRAIAEMVRRLGPAPIFGMGGFQLLPFYEGIRELGLQHYLINDERSGAFAADAYARVTGRPGIVDATQGPGATNLVTGLVESLNAGVPLIAIIGDTNRAYSKRNLTQEARQSDILSPACKELIRIDDGRRIPELMVRAYETALAGRPGPVVVSVPEDVAHEEYDFTGEDLDLSLPRITVPLYRTRPDRSEIESIADTLAKAQRPVILVGGGIHLSMAYSELKLLADKLGAPIAHTMSGKGSISCVDPLSVGVFGRYSRIANELIDESDFLLVVGCKLGEIATRRFTLINRKVTVAQLDVLPEELGRTMAISFRVACDAREGLRDLLNLLDARPSLDRSAYVDEIVGRNKTWQEEVLPKLQSSEAPIGVARLLHEINLAMPADGILIADGGFAGHWSGLLYNTQQSGRGYIADRGFASIGYGLPAAIGAVMGAPDRAVVALTGDGGFNMSLGELETARRENLPLTVVVLNNAASGYVKALQHLFFGGKYESADLFELNYARIAQEMGCRGIRVEEPEQLAGALSHGICETSVPTVIDVVVTRDPAKMLPGVDDRAASYKKGDRIA